MFPNRYKLEVVFKLIIHFVSRFGLSCELNIWGSCDYNLIFQNQFNSLRSDPLD